VVLIQTKYRRLRSFARIFSRTSESNTKSSRIDLPHSVAMAHRALDMAVNVAMEIVPRIGQTHMVALAVDMQDTTTRLLPIPQAAS
jgi:hypothetical protein